MSFTYAPKVNNYLKLSATFGKINNPAIKNIKNSVITGGIVGNVER
jgi:hypothetical protein